MWDVEIKILFGKVITFLSNLHNQNISIEPECGYFYILKMTNRSPLMKLFPQLVEIEEVIFLKGVNSVIMTWARKPLILG